MSKKITITDNSIKLHGLDNAIISVPKKDIIKLVPIKNHAYFPEIQTQVILNPNSVIYYGSDNWIYVTESKQQINNLILKKML